MIKFIKTTKWWMYIPFACFSYAMSKWVFKTDDLNIRLHRLIFILLNTIITSVIFTNIILKYIL